MAGTSLLSHRDDVIDSFDMEGLVMFVLNGTFCLSVQVWLRLLCPDTRPVTAPIGRSPSPPGLIPLGPEYSSRLAGARMWGHRSNGRRLNGVQLEGRRSRPAPVPPAETNLSCSSEVIGGFITTNDQSPLKRLLYLIHS